MPRLTIVILKDKFIPNYESRIKLKADFIIIPKICYETISKYAKQSKVITYNGYKEDIYIADYEPDTVETIIREPPDSLTKKIIRHFYQWRSRTYTCNFLVKKAKAKGHNATPKELGLRLSSYAQAFPGIFIDTGRVKNEIIIEKYLLQEIGIAPSPQQIETGYFDYVNKLI